MKFSDITVDMKVLPGGDMKVLGSGQEFFEHRNQLNVCVRVSSLQLQTFKMTVDARPTDPFAITPNSVVRP